MSNPTEQDLAHLRHAIRLSDSARRRGNRPFGAVLVSASGKVLAEAETAQETDRDATSHAETNALRFASKVATPQEIAASTMYASGEPCPMCSGAILHNGLRRVIYGISWQVNRPLMQQRMTGLMRRGVSCRDIFKLAPEPIEVIGPVLEEEAKAPFEAYAARGKD